MSKIYPDDKFINVMFKMAEGNPGAVSALMEIASKVEKIDPEQDLKWLGPFQILDGYEIYGAKIHTIWHDVCQRSTRNFIMILRAVQLGIISMNEIKDKLLHGKGCQFTEEKFKEMDEKVCKILTKFQKLEDNIV